MLPVIFLSSKMLVLEESVCFLIIISARTLTSLTLMISHSSQAQNCAPKMPSKCFLVLTEAIY
jgi:hypothetical protein